MPKQLVFVKRVKGKGPVLINNYWTSVDFFRYFVGAMLSGRMFWVQVFWEILDTYWFLNLSKNVLYFDRIIVIGALEKCVWSENHRAKSLYADNQGRPQCLRAVLMTLRSFVLWNVRNTDSDNCLLQMEQQGKRKKFCPIWTAPADPVVQRLGKKQMVSTEYGPGVVNYHYVGLPRLVGEDIIS